MAASDLRENDVFGVNGTQKKNYGKIFRKKISGNLNKDQ